MKFIRFIALGCLLIVGVQSPMVFGAGKQRRQQEREDQKLRLDQHVQNERMRIKKAVARPFAEDLGYVSLGKRYASAMKIIKKEIRGIWLNLKKEQNGLESFTKDYKNNPTEYHYGQKVVPVFGIEQLKAALEFAHGLKKALMIDKKARIENPFTADASAVKTAMAQT